MNKDLLQQALDALLEYDYAKTDKADKLGGAAICALRIALYQPFYSANYVQPEPTTERNFCARCGKRLGDADHVHTCTPPIAQPMPASAKPATEPVAFCNGDDLLSFKCGSPIPFRLVEEKSGYYKTPLYTTPQPAEGDAKDAQNIESNLWTIKEWAYLHLGAMHNITILANSAHARAAIASQKATV